MGHSRFALDPSGRGSLTMIFSLFPLFSRTQFLSSSFFLPKMSFVVRSAPRSPSSHLARSAVYIQSCCCNSRLCLPGLRGAFCRDNHLVRGGEDLCQQCRCCCLHMGEDDLCTCGSAGTSCSRGCSVPSWLLCFVILGVQHSACP